jgi:hypothetical protein
LTKVNSSCHRRALRRCRAENLISRNDSPAAIRTIAVAAVVAVHSI